MRVFFSPTCGACQQLLEKLAVSGMVGNVAFCPVAKNDEDVALLGAMVADGVTEASDLLKTPSGEWTEATLSLKFCLARNKMALARMGETGLPRVVGNDLFLSSRSGSWSPLSADPFGHSSQGGCGFGVDDDVCPSY